MRMKLHETKNDLRAKTRRAMIDLLNQELADVLDLGLQAKQAHWMSKVRTSSDCTNCSTKSPRNSKNLPTIWPNAPWNWEVWRSARFKSFPRNRGFPAIHWTWPPDRNTSLHYPARWQIVARARPAAPWSEAKPCVGHGGFQVRFARLSKHCWLRSAEMAFDREQIKAKATALADK